MNDWADVRRLVPPPRRRPGLLAIVIRWRYEIALVCGLAGVLQWAGATALWVAMLVLVTVPAVPYLRRHAVGLLLSIVVPHRVRSGLVQAGVGDRAGRPPWIVVAWPVGQTVAVLVWLRSGTTPDDVAGAGDVIASATGAWAVRVRPCRRRDRVVLLVHRPRWGWPGR